MQSVAGLSSVDRVSIPLLAKLIPGGIKPGSIFAVQINPVPLQDSIDIAVF